MTMTMKIKDGKMRLDLNPQVSSIVDLKTGNMISLMHEQKLVMAIPGASIKSLQQAHAQEAARASAPTRYAQTHGSKGNNQWLCV